MDPKFPKGFAPKQTGNVFIEQKILSIPEAFKFGEQLIYDFDYINDNLGQHRLLCL